MRKIPATLKKVISQAPMSWGVVALSDYRSKKKTANQIKKDFDKWLSINGNK